MKKYIVFKDNHYYDETESYEEACSWMFDIFFKGKNGAEDISVAVEITQKNITSGEKNERKN